MADRCGMCGHCHQCNKKNDECICPKRESVK